MPHDTLIFNLNRIWQCYNIRLRMVCLHMAKIIVFRRDEKKGEREMAEVSVFDVAKYILEKVGPLSTMKLQKLVYYSQAWSLVWDDLLFSETIEAWANGPVVSELYVVHRSRYKINANFIKSGDSSNLNETQKETINAVIKFYGDKTAQWLSDLTHSEQPWITARKGIPDGERGNSEIKPASMAEYYERI